MKIKPDNPALFIDLYELTVAASHYEHKRFSQSAFSLFTRNYPLHRSYFVSARLADAVQFLANFHFTAGDIAYLDTTGLFIDEFLHYLFIPFASQAISLLCRKGDCSLTLTREGHTIG
jgi:nicotinic acid phosphoribosyltransferase